MPKKEVFARGWLVELRNASHARYAIHDSGADEVGSFSSKVTLGPNNLNGIIVFGSIAVVIDCRIG